MPYVEVPTGSVKVTYTTWDVVGAVVLIIFLLAALAIAIAALVLVLQQEDAPFVHREDDQVQGADDATATVIRFTVPKYSRSFCYNEDTGAFTVKCGGYYNISSSLAISPAPVGLDPVQMYILVNGDTQWGTTQGQGQGGFLALNVDANVRLCKNDTFQIVIISQGAGAVDVTPTDAAPTRLVAARIATL